MITIFRHKLKRLLTDDRFSEILSGSAVALLARVTGTGLALVTTLMVARIYGAEMMGMLAIVQAIMMIASIGTVFGTNVSILRLIPEYIAKYSPTSAYKLYTNTQRFIFVLSVLVGAVLYLSADWVAGNVISRPEVGFLVEITAAVVLFKALMDLNTEAVRGLRQIRLYALMQVLPHVTMLLTLLVLMVFVQNTYSAIYAQLVAWIVTGVIGIVLMRRAFKKRIRPEDDVYVPGYSHIISISAPMFMTALMTFVIGQMGVLLLGMYRTAEEVGYYAAAVKLATLTAFVLQAVNSMAAPKFSELFHSGRMDDLFHVARQSSKLIFWSTTPVLLVLVLFGKPILSLFGEGFSAAYIPMLILVAGQFVNSISGSTGYFMNMTGNQHIFRNIMAVASLLNLLLCFLLIPKYGILGASIATALCLACWNMSILLYIKTKYGRSIGYIPFMASMA
ncbi:MAG: flippase [Gammaproteobacteria bacterium]|nr:flippase [Gammaproteobacteria bacterium]MCW8840442.1 flippase [Gammaproteobacteria bacterium]MCW8959138.1 flippase [Gammaproteobacteria bacterium]MCW8993307.1 flippase [Gammaproteobacteria bacterium]